MSRLEINDEINWMQRADEFLTERSNPPVDRQDRDRFEVRYFQQLEIAMTMKSGFEQGRRKVLQQTLLKQGTMRFGEPSDAMLDRLNSITDMDLLDALTDRLLDCDSWEAWLTPKRPPFVVRQAILEKLARIFQLSPDIRVGQMLAVLGFLSEDFDGQSLGVVEDDALLAVCENHLVDLMARESATRQSVSPDANKATGSRSATPVLKS